jgi:uncharacterized phiE125 gp8 family phage protein
MGRSRWSITQTTAPTEEPVTLAEMKLHLRQDFDTDDDLISGLIAACRRTASWTLYLDRWPADRVIRPPRPPLASVTSVKYIDTDGTQQTLASDQYDVDTDLEPGRISEAYGVSWPNHRDQDQAIEIEYVAGFGAASAVPDIYKAAIKILAGHWYQSREAVAVSIGGNIVKLPLGLETMLWTERVPMVA